MEYDLNLIDNQKYLCYNNDREIISEESSQRNQVREIKLEKSRERH